MPLRHSLTLEPEARGEPMGADEIDVFLDRLWKIGPLGAWTVTTRSRRGRITALVAEADQEEIEHLTEVERARAEQDQAQAEPPAYSPAYAGESDLLPLPDPGERTMVLGDPRWHAIPPPPAQLQAAGPRHRRDG